MNSTLRKFFGGKNRHHVVMSIKYGNDMNFTDNCIYKTILQKKSGRLFKWKKMIGDKYGSD